MTEPLITDEQTWEEALPLILHVYSDVKASAKVKAQAYAILQRMAQQADLYVDLHIQKLKHQKRRILE